MGEAATLVFFDCEATGLSGLYNTYINAKAGVYILASQKNSSPPPLKFFPVFVDFLRSFKLHKHILLTCVLLLFSLPFFKSSFKFFPVFQFG